MARAATKTIDRGRVEAIVDRLRHAAADSETFSRTLGELAADRSLNVAEVAEIARLFAGVPRPKTRKAAVSAIGQERLRLAHAHAKAASAARSRVW